MKFATQTIHSAYNPDEHNRALMPPLYQNSMFAMHELGENIPFRYSRLANPTRKILEDTVAALEHGTHGFAFASGMAAIDCIFRTYLQQGDTIVAVSDIYGGSYDLLTNVYAKWGVNVIFADLTQPENLDRILAGQPVKMLWLETPSNPLLRLVDIELLAQKAKAHGAIVGIDNTFATPYCQTPLDLGCDIVFHSATKYLCGHSDVLMGVAVVNDVKLAVRMKQHLENAQIIAEKLCRHPAIEKVFYPALPSHEHHELAKRQMRGFGGVVTVYLKNDTREAVNRFIAHSKLFTLASSLGGVECLVNHCYSQSHSGMAHDVKIGLGIKVGLLRLSIGIEDVDDIYADLDQALNATL